MKKGPAGPFLVGEPWRKKKPARGGWNDCNGHQEAPSLK